MTKSETWQQELKNLVTCPKELLELLELDMELLPAAEKAAKLFPLKVSRSFLNRITKNNRHDPLLKQVLPLQDELIETPGYSHDPLQEKDFNPASGLLHKYHGRVLLTLTGACGINCRFCFRRHFPYAENNPGTEGREKILEYLANDSTISEVILSGGDPLVVNDLTLKNLSQQLSLLPHIKRLRIHSRIPVVIPSRITDSFIEAVCSSTFKTVLVIHCNHPQELNEEVRHAMRKFSQAGILLLNQTVLLKDINDNVTTLMELSEKLADFGILPYYLHILDKVQGAAHFDTTLTLARTLHSELSKNLPGYLVPRLVCEQPGASSKVSMVGVKYQH